MSRKMQAQAAGKPSADDGAYLAQAADELIAAHGGDAREAIKELLGKVAFLEAARDRALDFVSFGYVRGKAGDK
jgi:hypothetical protein